jgi:hypothetical protein
VGIKTRNVDEVILNLHSQGTLTAAANKACAIVPFPGFIKNIYAKVDVAGTGVTATTVDINLNTVSIHSSTGITIAATTGVVTHGAYSTDPTQVSAGDILSLDIDGISIAPKNLCVTVVVSKRDPSATSHAADLR